MYLRISDYDCPSRHLCIVDTNMYVCIQLAYKYAGICILVVVFLLRIVYGIHLLRAAYDTDMQTSRQTHSSDPAPKIFALLFIFMLFPTSLLCKIYARLLFSFYIVKSGDQLNVTADTRTLTPSHTLRVWC